MLLVAEEAGAAHVGAEGFVGEPEFFAPDDARFHIGGEVVVELLLVYGHLGFVLGAEQDLHVCLADDGADGLEERGMVGDLHRLVARIAGVVIAEVVTGYLHVVFLLTTEHCVFANAIRDKRVHFRTLPASARRRGENPAKCEHDLAGNDPAPRRWA